MVARYSSAYSLAWGLLLFGPVRIEAVCVTAATLSRLCGTIFAQCNAYQDPHAKYPQCRSRHTSNSKIVAAEKMSGGWRSDEGLKVDDLLIQSFIEAVIGCRKAWMYLLCRLQFEYR
jgi:hypothetical protein